MKNFCKEVIEIIKDELHEIKYLNIEFNLRNYNLKTQKKRIQHTGTCLSKKDIKNVDENGIHLNKYLIILAVNIYEVDKLYNKSSGINNMKARFEEYLNNIGIKFNEKILFIITALHEIGHAMMVEQFRYHGMMEAYITYQELNTQMTNLVFTHRKIRINRKITKHNLRYELNPSELNADTFVYIKFPRIWNRLKHLVVND